jgi:hypothetical protein
MNDDDQILSNHDHRFAIERSVPGNFTPALGRDTIAAMLAVPVLHCDTIPGALAPALTAPLRRDERMSDDGLRWLCVRCLSPLSIKFSSCAVCSDMEVSCGPKV